MKNIRILVAFLFLIAPASIARAEVFTANLTGAQEVPPVSTSATGSARITLDAAAGTISYRIIFNNFSSAQTAAHIHGPAAIGVNGPVVVNFGAVGGTSGTITGSTSITPQQIALLRQNQAYVNVHSSSFPGGEIRGQIARMRPVDFDSDGRMDLSVLRFPNVAPPGVAQITTWNLNSTGNIQVADWGNANTDFPAPGDYDGDGRTDIAIYRAGATAGAASIYYILRSSNGTVQAELYGLNGDQTIQRDFDGDGKTDPAIFRRGPAPSSPTQFWIKRSSANYTDLVYDWGITGNGTTQFDTPVVADYDGDGKTDIAIYRVGLVPDNTYILIRSSDNGVVYKSWGNFQTDYVLPGDYDGDGKADYAVARTGSTSTSPMVWYIFQSSDNQVRIRPFGISSDLPTQGDYDGDGRTDLSVYRRGATASSASTFWIFQSFSNTPTAINWGLQADFPVNSFDSR